MEEIKCHYHQDKKAVSPCKKCGKSLCEECRQVNKVPLYWGVVREILCPECNYYVIKGIDYPKILRYLSFFFIVSTLGICIPLAIFEGFLVFIISLIFCILAFGGTLLLVYYLYKHVGKNELQKAVMIKENALDALESVK